MESIKLKSETRLARFQEYCDIALEGGYRWDDENKIVAKIIEAFGTTGRGITITGHPGSGKSFIFDVLKKITHPQSEGRFRIVPTIDIQADFSARGREIMREYDTGNICFDDLGVEGKAFHYGDNCEAMEEMIQRRYFAFKQGFVTHFTTNLNSKQITDRYGTRFISRLNEMTDVFILGGSAGYTDRRKLRNFKALPFVFHKPIRTEEEEEFARNYLQRAANAPILKRKSLGEFMRENIYGDEEKNEAPGK